MDEREVERLAAAVLSRVFIPLEASGRHVHITDAQAQRLFGHGLTPERPLSQPGQYLCRERVTVTGPKGELGNVAVLGPARRMAQVELSLTDGRSLGLKIPVRLSGDVENTPGCTLTGPAGTVVLDRGVMAAKRHIHLHPAEAERFGVRDGQTVGLRTETARPVVFQDVVVRVSPGFSGAAHLDYDEANACGFSRGDLGRLIL